MSPAEDTSINPRPPLVVVVDDQEWTARAFESVLSSHSCSVIRCASARHTLERLQSISPDALLIKADLPDTRGADLCRMLRERPNIGFTTPIIIASTAPMRRSERLEALDAGAWDVISLPFDAEELQLRMRIYLRSKFEVDRAREASLLDLTTGLYSIHGLLRRVRELSLDATRHNSPIACVVLGPDIRSMSAAEESDRTADRLLHLVNTIGRGSDVVGRLSLTEFVVVAPRTSSAGVLRMAERFHEAAAALFPADGPDADLKIRIGCYAVEDFAGQSVDPADLLVRAAMALRRAQRDTSAPPVCFFGQTYSVS